MGVLPAARFFLNSFLLINHKFFNSINFNESCCMCSAGALPLSYRKLMTDQSSPILDLYPTGMVFHYNHILLSIFICITYDLNVLFSFRVRSWFEWEKASMEGMIHILKLCFPSSLNHWLEFKSSSMFNLFFGIRINQLIVPLGWLLEFIIFASSWFRFLCFYLFWKISYCSHVGWQAICKLPFIDEARLLSEIAKVESTLTVTLQCFYLLQKCELSYCLFGLWVIALVLW